MQTVRQRQCGSRPPLTSWPKVLGIDTPHSLRNRAVFLHFVTIKLCAGQWEHTWLHTVWWSMSLDSLSRDCFCTSPCARLRLVDWKSILTFLFLHFVFTQNCIPTARNSEKSILCQSWQSTIKRCYRRHKRSVRSKKRTPFLGTKSFRSSVRPLLSNEN